ncbi:MAG: hypothetical protein QMD71_01900 [bacterium]|nr:hypothetical protein [bacterium]
MRKQILYSFITFGLLHGIVGTAQEKPEISFWDRWSVGVGYSPGICYTGEDLVGESQEEWDINPFRWLYWLNLVEGNVYYRINEKWEIEIGTGYGWARLKNRRVGYYNEKWEIEMVPITLNMVLQNAIFPDKYFLKFGGSFYLSRCKDIEKIYETDPDEPWKHNFVGYETIKGEGNGIGVSFSIGKVWYLSSFIVSNVSTGIKLGRIGYNSTSTVSWFPSSLDVTGIFIYVNFKTTIEGVK